MVLSLMNQRIQPFHIAHVMSLTPGVIFQPDLINPNAKAVTVDISDSRLGEFPHIY